MEEEEADIYKKKWTNKSGKDKEKGRDRHHAKIMWSCQDIYTAAVLPAKIKGPASFDVGWCSKQIH